METDVELPPLPAVLRKVLMVFCPQTNVPFPWLMSEDSV